MWQFWQALVLNSGPRPSRAVVEAGAMTQGLRKKLLPTLKSRRRSGDRFADGYFVRIFPEIGRNTTQEKWRAKVPDGTPAAVVEQLGPSFWDNYDRQDVRCTAILEAKLDEHKRAG